MIHQAAATRFADLIMSMTNPETPRWQKEQLENQARAAVKDYILRVRSINDEH